MTKIQMEIIEYLKGLNHGVKVKQKVLASKIDTSERNVRRQIELINKTIDQNNYIILSGKDGFWISKDKNEILENVKHIKSQALKMLKRYNVTIKKAGLPETNLFDINEETSNHKQEIELTREQREKIVKQKLNNLDEWNDDPCLRSSVEYDLMKEYGLLDETNQEKRDLSHSCEVVKRLPLSFDKPHRECGIPNCGVSLPKQEQQNIVYKIKTDNLLIYCEVENCLNNIVYSFYEDICDYFSAIDNHKQIYLSSTCEEHKHLLGKEI